MIRWIVRGVSCVSGARILVALLALGLTTSMAAAQGNGGNGGSTEAVPPPAAPPPPPAAPEPAAQEPARTAPLPGWVIAGDFRLRYEDTTKQQPGTEPGRMEPRHRMVMRLRGGVTKKLTNQIDFGVRLATGARGDPNTTDVTIGDFVDKFEINIDRAYMGWTYRNVAVAGGRYINPIVRTELVWDDDVNLQGVGGSYTFSPSRRVVPKFTAIYAIVDEQTTNPDSYMVGGQMSVRVQPSTAWNFTLAGGYFDYTIKSLTKADAGDILSNRLNATRTAYFSDFNLIDVVALLDSQALGPRWPIRMNANWVRNLKALKGEDQGSWVEVNIGRVSVANDTRYRYGFARAGTDAFVAAFSNDNTTFATNYVQHTMTAEYVVSPNAILNATWYVFRRDQLPDNPAPGLDKNFLSRLRLNATVSF
jgi:hypothetical protein